jgi:putative addiction module CopG family antidote
MDIRLKPEVEAMIREDLARGPYKSAEELVEQAVSQLHECEDWLAQHREEVAQKIEEGWQSAKQGPLMDAEEVESAMEAHMKAWPNTDRKE